MQTIKIDFDNPGLPQRLDVVENDAQSRFFKAVLYKDGKAYAAPSGATYSIMYRGFGPQNEGWYDTINDGAGKRSACSVSGNVVTCEIARQALRVPGHVSVVLCVTGSNGYMLHGWPIDCNCRNDNYTGGTSVESFFYITQITNADWTSAIKTWEELKNMIDPTLSLSGKAADAAKVGEVVNAEATRAKAAEEKNAKRVSQLKENITDTNQKGTYLVPIESSWEQGNFSYSDGNFSYSDNQYIIRSTFVDISMFNLAYPIHICVPDNLQILVLATDKNDGSYTILKAVIVWSTGTIVANGLTNDIKYIICKVRTAPDGKGLIVPADAKDIKFYGTRETKAYNTAKESSASAKGAMNVAREGLSLTTHQLSIKNLPKKNLLNVDGAVHGYYLNNKFNATDANNTWMAAIIDVNQYKTITLSGFPDKGGAYTAFLHGNSIEKWSMNAWNTRDNNGTHVIPDKYRFIGICWNAQTGENQLQIEYGDAATDFEAYELIKKSETIEYLNLHMSGNDAYIGKYLESVKAQPMYFAIIDDDTNTQKSVKKFYDICIANGVVGGYAVEARHLELDDNIVTMLRNYENEGFGCYLHCYNQAAQTPSGLNCWDTVNRTNAECLKYAEQDFNKGLRTLNSWGFLDVQSVWVVPGGIPDTDASRSWIMSMSQKRGFRYAINADPKKYITAEPNALNNRYNIPRFGLTNQVNDGNTEKLKSYIDSCASIGASMILMTHTGMWADENEEALTTRFEEVVQYAKSKGLINVNPLELLEKKYPIYMYDEMR